MNTNRIYRALMVLLAAMFSYTAANAHTMGFDTYLKIEGVPGFTKTVKITGAIFEVKFEDLVVTNYKVSIVDERGNPVQGTATVECKTYVVPHVLETSGRVSAPMSMNHQVVSPRDAASGLPTGKRQYQPIVFTKRFDKATPMLFNVLVSESNVGVSIKVSNASYDLKTNTK